MACLDLATRLPVYRMLTIWRMAWGIVPEPAVRRCDCRNNNNRNVSRDGFTKERWVIANFLTEKLD